jgi:hypothetical protein
MEEKVIKKETAADDEETRASVRAFVGAQIDTLLSQVKDGVNPWVRRHVGQL